MADDASSFGQIDEDEEVLVIDEDDFVLEKPRTKGGNEKASKRNTMLVGKGEEETNIDFAEEENWPDELGDSSKILDVLVEEGEEEVVEEKSEMKDNLVQTYFNSYNGIGILKKEEEYRLTKMLSQRKEETKEIIRKTPLYEFILSLAN